MQHTWDDYKADFEWDGSWRDIYVLGTSPSDWQISLAFLRSGPYQSSFYVAGEEAVLPSSIDNLFGRDAPNLLCINLVPVVLNCHFFNDWEIEFDLDPRDIKSQVQAELLFTFMTCVGNLLNKEVILTPENYQVSPIFRFSPSIGEVQYIPAISN